MYSNLYNYNAIIVFFQEIGNKLFSPKNIIDKKTEITNFVSLPLISFYYLFYTDTSNHQPLSKYLP